MSPYLKPERRSQCSRCPLSEWSPWRQPDLLSLNLSFWVPLGLIFINLHPMGPSGNSNQPILVHGVHILLNCIIPPRGFIPPMAGLWKRDWVIVNYLSLYHRLSFHSAWLFHFLWKGKVSSLGRVGGSFSGSGNSSKRMSRGSNTPLTYFFVLKESCWLGLSRAIKPLRPLFTNELELCDGM